MGANCGKSTLDRSSANRGNLLHWMDCCGGDVQVKTDVIDLYGMTGVADAHNIFVRDDWRLDAG